MYRNLLLDRPLANKEITFRRHCPNCVTALAVKVEGSADVSLDVFKAEGPSTSTTEVEVSTLKKVECPSDEFVSPDNSTDPSSDGHVSHNLLNEESSIDSPPPKRHEPMTSTRMDHLERKMSWSSTEFQSRMERPPSPEFDY